MKGIHQRILILILSLQGLAMTQETYEYLVGNSTDAATKCGRWCAKCSEDNTRCVECQGSNLVNGICVEANSCKHATWTVGDSYEICDECTNSSLILTAPWGKSGCIVDRKIQNCLGYSLTSACVACKDGFYAQSSICVARTPQPACKIFNNQSDSCSSCKDSSTHFLSNGICTERPKIDNCLVYNIYSTSCYECTDQYFPSYISEEKMTKCKLRTAKKCLTNSKVKDQCDTCPPFHYYWVYSCSVSKQYKGCDIMDGWSKCTTCYDGYYNLKGVCNARTPDLNCAIFLDAEKGCSICKDGFYLDSDLTCLKNTAQGCLTLSLKINGCQTCEFSTEFLDQGVCKKRISKEDCETLDEKKDGCATCKNPLTHYPNSAGACTSRTEDLQCQTSVLLEDKCAACKTIETHFINTSGICTLRNKDSECQTYMESEDKCSICKTIATHYLDPSGICTLRKEDATCKAFSETEDKCITCSSVTSHYLNPSGTCTLRTEDSNCQVFSATLDQCLSCKNSATHYLNTSAKCILRTEDLNCSVFSKTLDQCSTCKTLSTHYLKDGVCTSRTPNEGCKTFSQKTDACEACTNYTTHFLSKDGVCVKRENTAETCGGVSNTQDACSYCPSPSQDYFINETGICTKRTKQIDFCQTYLYNKEECNYCTNMITYYIATDGTCIERTNLDENCSSYENRIAGECTKCRYPDFDFINNEGRCTQRTLNSLCLKYELKADKCISCNTTTHYFDNGDCKSKGTDPQCSTFLVTSEGCEICKEGYKPVDGLCRPQTLPANCKRLKVSSDKCEKCNPEYYAVDGVCTPNSKMTGCAIFAENGCSQCSSSSFVRESDGTSCSTPIDKLKLPLFCELYSNNPTNPDSVYNCDKCKPGFVMATMKDRIYCLPEKSPSACLTNTCQQCNSPQYYAVYFSTAANMQLCKLDALYVAPGQSGASTGTAPISTGTASSGSTGSTRATTGSSTGNITITVGGSVSGTQVSELQQNTSSTQLNTSQTSNSTGSKWSLLLVVEACWLAFGVLLIIK